MNRYDGFTLLEVLVYLALFSLMVTGLLASALSVFEESDRMQTKVVVQEEGDFLLAKIDNALVGSSAVSTPAPGNSGNVLVLAKAGSTLVFSLVGGNLALQRGSAPRAVLNNANTIITSSYPVFAHAGSGNGPESVSARFIVNVITPEGQAYSQVFTTTKYLRK